MNPLSWMVIFMPFIMFGWLLAYIWPLLLSGILAILFSGNEDDDILYYFGKACEVFSYLYIVFPDRGR